MTTRYLDPTNDVAFKKIFSDKSRLMDFLNAVLRLQEGDKIKHLDFISQEELPILYNGRRSLFDIKCTDQKGHAYIVEMQNRPEGSFLNRVQCYVAHSYVSQAQKGGSHENLMPVVMVALSNRILFEDPQVECISYHRNVEDKTKKRFLYALSYVFIELPKFTKKADQLKTVEDEWLYFFANWKHAGRPPETTKDPLVLDAYDTIEKFNWSDAEYDIYFRMRLAAEAEEGMIQKTFDEAFEKGKFEGKEKGKAEGEEKGKAEGKAEGARHREIEIAKSMLSLGLDREVIKTATGLTSEEIQELMDKP